MRPVIAATTAANGVTQAAVPCDQQLEIAVDLRRSSTVSLYEVMKVAIARHQDLADDDRLFIEPWGPASRSRIWEFNWLYWKALDLWEAATGQMYESALPGGASDARNADAVSDLIREMFTWWDELEARTSAARPRVERPHVDLCTVTGAFSTRQCRGGDARGRNRGDGIERGWVLERTAACHLLRVGTAQDPFDGNFELLA